MINEPLYDEDLVNLGYLKSALKGEKEEVEINASKNYGSQPEPPYHIGDTWTEGPSGRIYTCINDRIIGDFNINDWNLSCGYIDQATANSNLMAAKEYADKKSNEAEKAAKLYAEAEAESKQILAQSYADGKITEEEQARINDVNLKLTTAKKYAEEKASEAEKAATEVAIVAQKTADSVNAEVLIMKNQIDRKIETYRQENDPALNWSTSIEKEKHLGDFWYDTINQTSYMYIKENNTYNWAENDVPRKLYDEINGKGTIYTEKPTKYSKNDMWIIENNITDIPDGCVPGNIVFSSKKNNVYDKLDWSKIDNYTPKDYVDSSVENSKEEIKQEIENTIKPSFLNLAKTQATELINTFNSGYFIKDIDKGIVYITDNINLDLAVKVWRWGLGGLAYSSNGVSGTYETAITADGKIVADFITAGSLSADRIKGGTLTLGGTSGINGLLKILDSSNQEMIIMDTSGIKLKNGSTIVGSKGVLSTIQIKSKEMENIGYVQDFNMNTVNYKPIFLEVLIPSNFIITSASIKIRHAPVKYLNSSGTLQFYGYARGLKIYSCTAEKINNYRKAAIIGSDFMDQYVLSDYTEINNALGTNGFTPTANIQNENVQEINSIELKNFLRNGSNRLMIRTSESIPTEEIYDGDFPINIAPMKRTAVATIFLNITGYTN